VGIGFRTNAPLRRSRNLRIVDMPFDGLGVLSGSTLLTTQSPSTGLSNGEIDDHLDMDYSEDEPRDLTTKPH
jgi:hypothetical protein